MADDGKLAFDIVLMEDAFNEQAERIIESFNKIGQTAVDEGKHIDSVFADLSKDFDVSTIEARMDALRSVIAENESTIISLDNSIKKMSEDARKALANEDYKTFRTLRQDISKAQESMTRIKAETADYRNILHEIENAAGKVTSAMPHETARFFATEDDYNHAKELTAQIEELRRKLAETFDQAERNTINEQIIGLQKELDGVNRTAADAAAALGDKIGGKAAEVSGRFYELNAAVKEQQRVFDELNAELEETEKALSEATTNGDIQKVVQLQNKYFELAEQVNNAGDALSDLKGKQKDAEGAFDKMQDTIGESVEAIGNLVSGDASFKTIIRSVSQLSGLFKTSGTGLTALAGGMRGVSGAANLAKVSLKGLWGAMLSNPIGMIIAAIAAFVAIITKLAKSIKTTSDRMLEFANIEAANIKYTESVAKRKAEAYDEAIRAKQREIDIAKSANKSIREIYKLEDELYGLQRDKAMWQKGYFKVTLDNLDAEYQKLDNLNWQLRNAEIAQGKKESEFTITIDGETSEDDIEKQIDILKQHIENTEAKIRIVTEVKENVAETEAAKKKQENDLKQQAKQVASIERQALRDAASARISLIGDTYKRDVESAKEASRNKIADLRLRLSEEANLTAAARKAINEQIETENKALNKRLLDLERAHVENVKDIWQEVEDIRLASVPKTMSSEGADLWRQFVREDEAIQRQMAAEENADIRAALEAKSLALYHKYLRDREQLAKEHAERSIAIEEQTIQLRLDAAREGSIEEYKLRVQLLEKQREAELHANSILPKEQQQSETDINAKYNKQRQQMVLEFSSMLAQNDAEYNAWLKRIESLTVGELEKLLAASKRALGELLKRRMSGDILVDQSEIDALMAKIAELESLIKSANLTPSEKGMQEWKKLASYVNDLGSAFSDLGDTIGETTGNVISFLGNTISTIGSTITAVTEGIEKVGETTSMTLKAVEAASVILAVISAALKIVKSIMELLNGTDKGAERLAEANKRFENTVHSLTRAYEEFNRQLDKAYGSERAATIRELIRLKEEEIEATRGNNRELRRRYYELLRRKERYEELDPIDQWINNLLGTSVSWTSEQQQELDRLEEQLRDSVDSVEDLQNEIADLREQMVDAIFGEDIQSAIERFAEALTKAWEDGKDASESVKDFINNMIKEMLKQELLNAVSGSGMMARLRSMLSAWFKTLDLGITQSPALLTRSLLQGVDTPLSAGIRERITPTLEDIYTYGEQMADAFSGLGDIYRQFMTDVEGERSAQAAGLQSVSQESFDETSGRITSIQGHTFNISENSNIIRENVSAINGNVAMIRDYTSHLVQMDANIQNMRNDIDTIRRHGVTINS